MQFREFKLSDKEVFDRCKACRHFMGAERSFACMYTWQYGYNVQVAMEENLLFIRGGKSEQDAYYLMPIGCGDIRRGIDLIMEDAHSRGIKTVFRQIYEDDIALLKNEYGFSIEEDRDMADYVYLVDRLIGLKGKKLHSKRNFLNRFMQTEHTFEEITAENIEEAKAFALSTLEGKENTEEEEVAIRLLMDNFDALDQKGAVIRTGGKVIAVTAGEVLNDNTAVIHLEKADSEIVGAYQAINQMFLQNCFADMEYVNREEDMGLPGLRKAKMSYYPDILLMKYTAKEA